MPNEPETHLRELLLKAIAAQDSSPWYSRDYAAQQQIPREQLFAPLNDLRMSELVELTEWQPNVGQGYRITEFGKVVVQDPVFLAQLRTNQPPQRPQPVSTEFAPAEPTPLERGDIAREAIYSERPAMMVSAIMLINIVCFIVALGIAVADGVPFLKFLAAGDIDALTRMGALGLPELAQGQWYRLLACCFLHFGLLHITLNMTSLYLSRKVEQIWGTGRFLILYVTCGICGSVAAMLYDPGQPDRPVYLAGASGALWGVMTSQITWLLLNRQHFAPRELQQWLSAFSYTMLLNIGMSLLPNISMAAHLGGGIAGIIATPLLQIHRFGLPIRRLAAGALLALLPTLFLTTLAMAIERDARMKSFTHPDKVQQPQP